MWYNHEQQEDAGVGKSPHLTLKMHMVFLKQTELPHWLVINIIILDSIHHLFNGG